MFSKAINPTAFVGRYEKLAGRSAVSERSGERSSLDLTEDIIAFFCKDEKNVEIADVFNPANYTFRSPENIMKSILELLAINWEQLGNMPFADAITVCCMVFSGLATGFLDHSQFGHGRSCVCSFSQKQESSRRWPTSQSLKPLVSSCSGTAVGR